MELVPPRPIDSRLDTCTRPWTNSRHSVVAQIDKDHKKEAQYQAQESLCILKTLGPEEYRVLWCHLKPGFELKRGCH